MKVYEYTGAFADNTYPLSSPSIDVLAELGGIYLFRLAEEEAILVIYSW